MLHRCCQSEARPREATEVRTDYSISTSSRPPNEHDEAMGITQVDPREAERLEFQDVEEGLSQEVQTDLDVGARVPGVSHGGFGRSSLQKCLDRLNQAKVDAPAPCHSGVDNENPSNPFFLVFLIFRQTGT